MKATIYLLASIVLMIYAIRYALDAKTFEAVIAWVVVVLAFTVMFYNWKKLASM